MAQGRNATCKLGSARRPTVATMLAERPLVAHACPPVCLPAHPHMCLGIWARASASCGLHHETPMRLHALITSMRYSRCVFLNRFRKPPASTPTCTMHVPENACLSARARG
eukprot:12627227-Alexandrium_andersonii.AAC.1